MQLLTDYQGVIFNSKGQQTVNNELEQANIAKVSTNPKTPLKVIK